MINYSFKDFLVFVIGCIGGAISTVFGGWTQGMTALIIMMAIDYITGLLVAGVFKKSPKTKTGALQSKAGLKGLCKKGVMLLIVLVAAQLDIVLSTTFVKDAAVIGFMTNEMISIVENAGLMGIPIPKKITKAIDLLKQKEDGKNESK